jgi:adenylate cyclase class 2
MLEIEQKYANVDFSDLEQRLARLGARPGELQEESDQYLNAPDRDFAATGEAFRLRRIGAKSMLTYKGVKLPDAVKVRTELEVPLADGETAAADCLTLLQHLGYRFVAVVHKKRRPFYLQRGGFETTVCLDDVDELGRFAEVEVVAPDDAQSAASATVSELAAELGLISVERRSYLGMLLAARNKERT